ncbi:MAG: spermidine/putrescine ABC transporter substrate-binding protein [Proteobacteria bacterium]|nr:spermidine/putrescine ABC transporter substrate-binding protein [Pseudomonadota bacterium]
MTTSTFLLCLPLWAFASSDKIVNVYLFSGEVPDSVVREFEAKTGIKVNYTAYDSNETMYAKLKAKKNPGYDVIQPSSYFIDKMRQEDMLQKIDKSKLKHFGELDPRLLDKAYDPKNDYSIPYLWGITGIFANSAYYPKGSITSWAQFWDKRFTNQLLLANDPREFFSITLLTLGYSINDTNPKHIKEAYEKMQQLLPNIKIFNSAAATSIIIDEDAYVGMAWNGDVYKANKENPNVQFIFPEDGFIIWVDNLAIPKNAPHLENAYAFLNFVMQAKNTAQATINYGYASANLKAKEFLPKSIKNNPIIYPSEKVLAQGEFQKDIGQDALKLYEKYWELLKISA